MTKKVRNLGRGIEFFLENLKSVSENVDFLADNRRFRDLPCRGNPRTSLVPANYKPSNAQVKIHETSETNVYSLVPS